MPTCQMDSPEFATPRAGDEKASHKAASDPAAQVALEIGQSLNVVPSKFAEAAARRADIGGAAAGAYGTYAGLTS